MPVIPGTSSGAAQTAPGVPTQPEVQGPMPLTDDQKKVEAHTDYNNQFWKTATVIKAKASAEEMFAQKAASTTGDAQGFTEDYLKDYDKGANDVISKAPDPKLQEEVKNELSNYRQVIGQRAVGHEAQASYTSKLQDTKGILDTSVSRVAQSPELFDDAMGDMKRISDFLPTDTRANFEGEYKSKLSRAAIGTMMDQDPEGAHKEIMSGKFAEHLNDDDKKYLATQAQVKINQNQTIKTKSISDAQNAIRSTYDKFNNLDPVVPEELDSLAKQANLSNDQPTIDRYNALKEQSLDYQHLTSLPILKAKEFAATASPEIQTAFKKMESMAKQQPLSFENKMGTISLQPLADNDVSSFIVRRRDVEFTNDRNPQASHSQVLTPEEVTSYAGKLKEMKSDDIIRLAGNMQHGLGYHVDTAINQLAKQNPLEAHAMGLAIMGGEHEGVAKNMLDGQAALKANPGLRQELFKDNVNHQAFMAHAATAFPDQNMAGGIMNAANALYAQKKAETGAGQFDGKVYQDCINKAVGGTDDPRTGIQNINGRKTILPPGITDDQFERYIQAMPEAIQQHATFHHEGGGWYDIRMNGHKVTDVLIEPKDIEEELKDPGQNEGLQNILTEE